MLRYFQTAFELSLDDLNLSPDKSNAAVPSKVSIVIAFECRLQKRPTEVRWDFVDF